jgi:hypothetical protein
MSLEAILGSEIIESSLTYNNHPSLQTDKAIPHSNLWSNNANKGQSSVHQLDILTRHEAHTTKPYPSGKLSLRGTDQQCLMNAQLQNHAYSTLSSSKERTKADSDEDTTEEGVSRVRAIEVADPRLREKSEKRESLGSSSKSPLSVHEASEPSCSSTTRGKVASQSQWTSGPVNRSTEQEDTRQRSRNFLSTEAKRNELSPIKSSHRQGEEGATENGALK